MTRYLTEEEFDIFIACGIGSILGLGIGLVSLVNNMLILGIPSTIIGIVCLITMLVYFR